jgi:hypothetical protein
MAIRFFCLFLICGAVRADFPALATRDEVTTEDVHSQLLKLREDVVKDCEKTFWIPTSY